jgi:energy-converting hydrogenase Eha subunit C
MEKTSIKLGYWTSLICIATFIIWTGCFMAIFKINPIFKWTNLADYITYTSNYNQSFKYLAQTAMLVFAPAFLILLHSINDYASENKKILSRISVSFGTMFAACMGIHYFIQISSVRLSIANGQIAGLEQFIQSNPTSGIAGINLVGWTLFFSLACFFIAPIFTGSRLNKVIKYALISNGIICVLGGIGYVFDNIILIFLTLNLGMGAATLTATIALLMFFRRLSLKGKI